MATKLGRVVTYNGGTPDNYSRDLLMCGHVTNEKPYNCISTIQVTSKSGRVVT